jgi:hypothetical protein
MNAWLSFGKQLSENIHQTTIGKVKYENEECLFNDSVV